MNYEETLRKEAERISARLAIMEPKGEDYKTLLDRLTEIQKILDNETVRTNSIIELKKEEKRIALDSEKLEFEQVKLEQEEIRAKKNARGQWFFEIGKKFLGVLSVAAVTAFVVMLDNSGITIPNKYQKFIDRKDIW